MKCKYIGGHIFYILMVVFRKSSKFSEKLVFGIVIGQEDSNDCGDWNKDNTQYYIYIYIYIYNIYIICIYIIYI